MNENTSPPTFSTDFLAEESVGSPQLGNAESMAADTERKLKKYIYTKFSTESAQFTTVGCDS